MRDVLALDGHRGCARDRLSEGSKEGNRSVVDRTTRPFDVSVVGVPYRTVQGDAVLVVFARACVQYLPYIFEVITKYSRFH